MQTAQEWTKSYLELIASYICTPQNSNNLRSHLRSIVAFHHRRLIRPGKNQAEFCVRQLNFTKSCQQIWVLVNQPFIPFIYHIWGETVLWGTVFIIQTSDKMQYFNFAIQIVLIQYSGRSKHRSKNVQNHLLVISINWHHHIKGHVEIGHLTKFGALRLNRDQVMTLETWLKTHTNLTIIIHDSCNIPKNGQTQWFSN